MPKHDTHGLTIGFNHETDYRHLMFTYLYNQKSYLEVQSKLGIINEKNNFLLSKGFYSASGSFILLLFQPYSHNNYSSQELGIKISKNTRVLILCYYVCVLKNSRPY